MRAAVLHGRDDLRIESVPIPVPGPGEVLLRNQVALTCGTDAKVLRRGYHARMITPPAIFGHEVSGVVEEVGPGIDGLVPGTPVALANSAPCGDCPECVRGRASLCDDLLFWNGAYAEFSLIPARIVRTNLLPHGPGMTHRAAALLEPLACAVRGIEACRIEPGQTVAVVGAGPLGLMLIALARARGARVLAAGRNKTRLARAAALGAVATVSALDDLDLAAALRRHTEGERGPEVVIEAAGTLESAEAAFRAVRKGGLVNLFAGCPAEARISLDLSKLHYEEIGVTASFHHSPASVRTAFALIAEGTIAPEPFVTGEAGLEETPAILRQSGDENRGPKTAILPWGVEPPE
jgi:L-iditol 2-dehydrogenase